MINQLIEKIRRTGAPIVAGLDPVLKFVPEHIKQKAYAEYGETMKGAAEAVWLYNKAIVDAIYDLIPAVKPQIAMYEQFGIPGLAAFKRTVDYCREKGLVVIGDVKRGDIGSTSAAYAAAHLGRVQVGSSLCAGFEEDFVTVNPYLGSDGVQPFIDVCREEKRGIFILVKTSNPSSGEFQDRLLRTGVTAGTAGEDAGGISSPDKPLYEVVGEKVAEWSEQLMGENGYSYIGAVVGATYPEQGSVLRRVMPKSFILVPGYGAQGGTGKDLIHFFDENRLGAIVNSSRGIIAAYQSGRYGKFGPEGFADASRQAVIDMITDIDQAFASVGR